MKISPSSPKFDEAIDKRIEFTKELIAIFEDRNRFMVDQCVELVEMLNELKRLRMKEVYDTNKHAHGIVDFRGSDDLITAVICKCGLETKYRVPLTSLSDFQCPRDPNREGRKET